MKTYGRIKHGTCECCNSKSRNRAHEKAAKRSERQATRQALKTLAKNQVGVPNT